MKKIILISTFCDTEEKQNILSENIDILKNQGLDVMCLSPNFIQLPHNIVEKSDFVFYTKENPLLSWPERAFTFWKTINTNKGIVRLTHFLVDYGWAALYQVKKLSEIALTYDYDIFYHIIYDTVIDEVLIEEINKNEVNKIFLCEKPNGNIQNESLQFMVFDRETMEKIVKEITIENYKSTNGVAEDQVTKWKEKFNLLSSETPVKEIIYFYKDKDFFNYGNNSEFKMFFNKHFSDVEIWKGEPPKGGILNSLFKIVFYDINSDVDINIKVNNIIKSEKLIKGENKMVVTDLLCKDITSLTININNEETDYTQSYFNLNRSYISNE
jgi:hypothetical protein